jgi:hypothetical protein
MSTLHRAPWCLLVAVTVAATATIAMASSLSVTSANLTVFRTCVVTGYPTTSTAVIDSAVKQDSATSNFGTATSVDVQSQSTNKNHRSYVNFDLSKCSPAIPSTASVKVASLRLLVATVPTACRTHDVFRVTANWTESGITWNTQPAASGTRTSFANVGAAPCANSTNNLYVSWDVTADAQAFVAGTATNFGWMIRDDVENASTTARTGTYYTQELGFLGSSPQLVVTYL